MTIREATELLFKRYLTVFTLNEELEILSRKAIEEINNYPIDKLSRWLGFIQGYIIFTNQSTVDIERNFSRPLFHKAYEYEGLFIPKRFSTKEERIKNEL